MNRFLNGQSSTKDCQAGPHQHKSRHFRRMTLWLPLWSALVLFPLYSHLEQEVDRTFSRKSGDFCHRVPGKPTCSFFDEGTSIYRSLWEDNQKRRLPSLAIAASAPV